MAVKTIHSKPRRDRFYIVDYKRLNNPVLIKYEFKTQEIAYKAIVNNLSNDIKRYNTISGKEARKHNIRFGIRKNQGRIWPDRKYNYPIEESLTSKQKHNYRNKLSQKAYLERKRKKNEHLTKNNPSYIDSQPERWRNLKNTRRLAKCKNRDNIVK